MSTSSERPNAARPLTVGLLTLRIAQRLQAAEELRDVWVEGEVAECTTSAAGHVYFTLRDSSATLRCILFSAEAAAVALSPRNGARLVAHGMVQVYAKSGSYSLLCDELRPAGAGDAHLRLEALRRRLEAEGLFRAERKRPLPPAPRRVGVVTSPTGAAWRDVQTVVARRDPRVEIVFAPAQVQGQGAVESMIGALDGLAQLRDLDVAILARGGGASEELWPFNDEALVRAIARFPRAVVTGVGHESDTTLADHVADVRAPTPSVAAELVVPDASGTAIAADRLARRIAVRMRDAIDRRRRRAVAAKRMLDRRAPAAKVASLRVRLDDAQRSLDKAARRLVTGRRGRAVTAKRRLDALSPLAVLGRGYAIVEATDGRVRADARALRAGEDVTLRMRDGRAAATVKAVPDG